MTVWASTQTPFPNQQAIAQAHRASRRRTSASSRRSWAAASAARAAAASRRSRRRSSPKPTGKPVQVVLDPRRGVLLRRVPAGGGRQDQVGHRRRGQDLPLGLPGLRGGSAQRRAVLRRPEQPDRGRTGAGAATRRRCIPSPPARGARPGANINVFARESQIDIMAAKAKVDPLEFRLNNTTDTRMRRVLEAAAERFGWKKAAGPSGRGVGVACGIDAGTYVALIAEVKVDAATGTRAGQADRLRAGHGRRDQPRRREDADGRLHHDGPRVRRCRRRCASTAAHPHEELRHVRAAAVLGDARSRDGPREERRPDRRRAAASRRSSRWARPSRTPSSTRPAPGSSRCR